jgi:hypothetical protein
MFVISKSVSVLDRSVFRGVKSILYILGKYDWNKVIIYCAIIQIRSKGFQWGYGTSQISWKEYEHNSLVWLGFNGRLGCIN